MSSHRVENSMKKLFSGILPLSPSQIGRLAEASVSLTLAKTVQLSQMANWVGRPTQKAGRERFLERLLESGFVCQSHVYHPLLEHFLSGQQPQRPYVIIDRSVIAGREAEMLMVSVSYRRRAIPIGWQVIDFGCTGVQEQLALWQRLTPVLKRLYPAGSQVCIQGDTEFGAVETMRYFRQQGWDFLLAQASNTSYRLPGQTQWLFPGDLPITPHRAVYVEKVTWTQQHQYGPLTLFGFYQPHQNSPESSRRNHRYCVTNLPKSHMLRVIGRHRWGTECLFKDFKSAGFNLEASQITSHARWEKLLVLLSVNYLWLMSVGRWLCKTGKRQSIEHSPNRKLSLFRLGYDWVISEFRQGREWPHVSTLYS